MGLQLFNPRSKENDSFNQTDVYSVLRNAAEMRYGLDYNKYKRFLPSIQTAKANSEKESKLIDKI